MPPIETDFTAPLDTQALNYIRMRFTKSRGQILSFLVQYETIEDGERVVVTRYDTAHGRAHQDIFYRSGRKVKVWLGDDLSYNEHMQRAVRDIRMSWSHYRERYFRG
ncbi:MAG: hypothetical protein M3464_02350 [Chloroflexota bacterium]|nr:hypothetical protein [Chloroflexota bacterium]